MHGHRDGVRLLRPGGAADGHGALFEKSKYDFAVRTAQGEPLTSTYGGVDDDKLRALCDTSNPLFEYYERRVGAMRRLLAEGDRVTTYAEISAQGISIEMPTVQLDETISEGDRLQMGELELEVWHTPGHTLGQLAFRLGNLLFSGDNIYRDGCVGNIDAHHGSDIPSFIESLTRIRDSDIEWLLPSHGPPFRKDDSLLQATIDRLEGYCHMADFGTCATDWPLMDEWDRELVEGFNPN